MASPGRGGDVVKDFVTKCDAGQAREFGETYKHVH